MKKALVVLAVLALVGVPYSALIVKWVVINDLHCIDDSAKSPYKKLSAAVHTAIDSQANFLVLNGDLISNTLGASTDSLFDSTRLKWIMDTCELYDSTTVYICGNHDEEKWGVLWFTRIMGSTKHRVLSYGNVRFVNFYTGWQYTGVYDTSALTWLDSTATANSTKMCIGLSHIPIYPSTSGPTDVPDSISNLFRAKLEENNNFRFQLNGHAAGTRPKLNNIQYFTVSPNNYYTYPNNSYYLFALDTTSKTIKCTGYGVSDYSYSGIALATWLYDCYFAAIGTSVTADTIRNRLTRFGLTDTIAQKFLIGQSDYCVVNTDTLRTTRRGFKTVSSLYYYETDREYMTVYGDKVKKLIDSTSGSSLKTRAQAQ